MLASKQQRGKLNFDKLPKRVTLSFITQPMASSEIRTNYESEDGDQEFQEQDGNEEEVKEEDDEEEQIIEVEQLDRSLSDIGGKNSIDNSAINGAADVKKAAGGKNTNAAQQIKDLSSSENPHQQTRNFEENGIGLKIEEQNLKNGVAALMPPSNSTAGQKIIKSPNQT